VGTLVVATSPSGGGTQLAGFTYTANGTVTNGSNPALFSIPATSPSSGCAGNPNSLNYDRANHLLFLAFDTTSSTVDVCSYTVSPTTGTISYASETTPQPGQGFGFDSTDMLIVGGSTSAYWLFTYSASGQFTSGTFSGSGFPSGANVTGADFVNGILWYGINNQQGSSPVYTVQGACKFLVSGGNASISGCTAFSSSITYDSPFDIDSSDGLILYTNSLPNNCSSTSTVASILIYNKSSGAFSNASNIPEETLGNCVYVVNNPVNSNQSADITDHLFFGPAYGSSSVSITPYPFSATGSFLTPLTPVTIAGGGSIGQSLVFDPVNHLVFVLGSSSGSNGNETVTQLTGIPYTTSGFSSSGVPTGLSFSNDTINSCSSIQCNYGLIAILN
jgi:hypothetical protein